MALLPEEKRGSARRLTIPPRVETGAEPAIVARNLTRRFGNFTAVNAVNFTIERGEIFGFLGSNGCGKSTTMKMLTGLLPATEGEAMLFGKPVDAEEQRCPDARGVHVAGVLALRRADGRAEPLDPRPPLSPASRVEAVTDR